MAPSLAPPQHKPQSSASALSDGPLYFPPAALFLGISGHPILGFEQASLHAIVAECFFLYALAIFIEGFRITALVSGGRKRGMYHSTQSTTTV